MGRNESLIHLRFHFVKILFLLLFFGSSFSFLSSFNFGRGRVVNHFTYSIDSPSIGSNLSIYRKSKSNKQTHHHHHHHYQYKNKNQNYSKDQNQKHNQSQKEREKYKMKEKDHQNDDNNKQQSKQNEQEQEEEQERSRLQSKEQLTIAVDLDEVLGQFVASLSNFHNDQYGTSITVQDFHSYEFHHVWGGTPEEASVKVNEFFQSKYFLEEIRKEPFAYETLLTLKESKKFDFKLVTSRQLAIQQETEKWIEEHYPGIFSSLHFGNHYGSSGKKVTKGEICESIGAKVLIDDQMKYALDCSQKGLYVLLYGQYPWNKSLIREEHANISISTSSASSDADANSDRKINKDKNLIFPVNDWNEVKMKLLNLSSSQNETPSI